jgi:hypothetical protein
MSDDQRTVLGSGELLSLAQVAQQTPYSPAYLNLLARQGKLPAMKIARNWVTTSVAVRKYIKKQTAYHRDMVGKLSASGKELL